jgi:hypothetical protein
MTRSIPEHVVERLFSRMASVYGSKFLDQWRDVDMVDMKATWREGLAGLTDEALKRGVAALFHERVPPTLPRFLELCAINPAHVAPVLPAITHQHVITDNGNAALAHVHALLARFKVDAILKAPKDDRTHIEWAFKIIRDANESNVPLNKLAIAQDAIRMWCASHGVRREDLDDFGKVKPRTATHAARADLADLPKRVPSPHIYGDDEHHTAREPGSDDE